MNISSPMNTFLDNQSAWNEADTSSFRHNRIRSRPVQLVIAIAILSQIMQYVASQEAQILGERRITPLNEVARDNSLIRAAIRMGGEDRVFVVDTGATPNFLDEHLRTLCNEAIGEGTVLTVNGKLKLPFYESANASIGERNLQLGPIGVLDLGELSSIVGCQVSTYMADVNPLNPDLRVHLD